MTQASPPTPDADRPPREPPVPAGDDMETVKRFFAIAAAAFVTGLLFLGVCAYVVAKHGG